MYLDVSGATTNYAIVTNAGTSIFNEGGGDYDFRIEGDTEANLLFIDASADRIGIGTNAPGNLVDIQISSTSNIVARIYNTNNTANPAGAMLGVTVGGTTSTGDPMVQMAVSGGEVFTLGVDNSDSDSFVIANSTTLGTTNVLRIGTDRGLGLIDGITAPAATAGYGKIFIDTADGDLKIIFGDGTTKLIVADT